MRNKNTLTFELKFRSLHREQRWYRTGSASKLGIRIKAQSATETGIGHTTTVNESQDVHEPHYVGKKALIVGAGPAGSLAASFLSKQGFIVEVYEKRKDPTENNFAPNRSTVMVLNGKSINILKAAEIEVSCKAEEYSSPIRQFLGVMNMKSNGEFIPPRRGQKITFITQRLDLAKHIISTVKGNTPDDVHLNFEHSCIGVDLKKKEVSFQYNNNAIVKKSYDLLIGADGSNSQIREAMEEQIDSFTVSPLHNLKFYKSLPDIVVDEDTVPDKYKKMLQLGLVTAFTNINKFNGRKGLDRMSFSRVGNGNLIGNFTGSRSGFDNIKDREKEYLTAVMPAKFPQDWIDQIIPQLRNNTLYRAPSVVEVSTFIGPDVVLIGDAGHGVSSRMGIGCNLAINDTQVLNDALESAKGDINQALRTYNNLRYNEVICIQQLEKTVSAGSYKQEGIKKLLPFIVNLHNIFHLIGHGYLPWLIPMSAFLKCTIEEVSPQEAIRILQIEFAVLSVVAATITSIFFKALLGVS